MGGACGGRGGCGGRGAGAGGVVPPPATHASIFIKSREEKIIILILNLSLHL